MISIRMFRHTPPMLFAAVICVGLLLIASLLARNERQETLSSMDNAARILDSAAAGAAEGGRTLLDDAASKSDALARLAEQMQTLPRTLSHPIYTEFLLALRPSPHLGFAALRWDDGLTCGAIRFWEEGDPLRGRLKSPLSALYATFLHRDGNPVLISYLGADLRPISTPERLELGDTSPFPALQEAVTSLTVMESPVGGESAFAATRRFSSGAGAAAVGLSRQGMASEMGRLLPSNDSRLYLFSREGRIIASGDPATDPGSLALNAEPVTKAVYTTFTMMQHAPYRRRTIMAGSSRYLSQVTSLPRRYGSRVYSGLAVPSADLGLDKLGSKWLGVLIALLLGAAFGIPLLIDRFTTSPENDEDDEYYDPWRD